MCLIETRMAHRTRAGTSMVQYQECARTIQEGYELMSVVFPLAANSVIPSRAPSRSATDRSRMFNSILKRFSRVCPWLILGADHVDECSQRGRNLPTPM